jgi:protein arginine kinase activator
MKCQRCPKAATFHITEVFGPAKYLDFHFCEDCAQRHLSNPTASVKSNADAVGTERESDVDPGGPSCKACGLKFIEFRNSGRLGCPRDYDAFREELLPLLDNIHGETRHTGKKPRGLPARQANEAELVRLRGQLDSAVAREAYEEAARLRDRIRQLDQESNGV